jgi:hypothetical protein
MMISSADVVNAMMTFQIGIASRAENTAEVVHPCLWAEALDIRMGTLD